MFGRPTRRISTRWTARCGPTWKKKSRLLDAHSGAAERAWDKITEEQCATIVGNFRKRLRKYIVAKGGNFENML